MTTETPTCQVDEPSLTTAEALRRTLGSVAGCGAALATIALLWLGWRPALYVVLGAAVAVANLYVLGRVAVALLAGGAPKATWGVVGLLKLAVLFGGIKALFEGNHAVALPVLMGYGALPIGITVAPLFLRAPSAPSSTTSTTSS